MQERNELSYPIKETMEQKEDKNVVENGSMKILETAMLSEEEKKVLNKQYSDPVFLAFINYVPAFMVCIINISFYRKSSQFSDSVIPIFKYFGHNLRSTFKCEIL